MKAIVRLLETASDVFFQSLFSCVQLSELHPTFNLPLMRTITPALSAITRFFVCLQDKKIITFLHASEVLLNTNCVQMLPALAPNSHSLFHYPLDSPHSMFHKTGPSSAPFSSFILHLPSSPQLTIMRGFCKEDLLFHGSVPLTTIPSAAL